eukprot:jgi/Mesvir1/24265/Mv10966-RA.1
MVMGHHGKRKFAAIVLSGSTHAGSLVTDETFDCKCGHECMKPIRISHLQALRSAWFSPGRKQEDRKAAIKQQLHQGGYDAITTMSSSTRHKFVHGAGFRFVLDGGVKDMNIGFVTPFHFRVSLSRRPSGTA